MNHPFGHSLEPCTWSTAGGRDESCRVEWRPTLPSGREIERRGMLMFLPCIPPGLWIPEVCLKKNNILKPWGSWTLNQRCCWSAWAWGWPPSGNAQQIRFSTVIALSFSLVCRFGLFSLWLTWLPSKGEWVGGPQSEKSFSCCFFPPAFDPIWLNTLYQSVRQTSISYHPDECSCKRPSVIMFMEQNHPDHCTRLKMNLGFMRLNH